MLPLIDDADIGSLLILSIFDKYLDHMLLKLNKFTWSELHKIKMLNHFRRSVCAILEDVNVTEIID